MSIDEDKLQDLHDEAHPKLYREYIINENGQHVLKVELLKALYGLLRAAVLFWLKLRAALIAWGFEINPYDW